VIRLGVLVVALAAALAVHAAPGHAADECASLPVCIPVAGPWVAIPAPQGGTATATWRLKCPQGVIGGVDARASEKAVAVEFPGLIGSPVNPGITTRGSLLFKGTYAGLAHRATSYEPFIGCIPGGGGGPRTPVSYTAVAPVKPGSPITVRVATLRVVEGTLVRTTFACPARERLLHATHSVGLYTAGVPSVAELAAVRVVQVRRGAKILVSATRRGIPKDVRAEVQIQAECAR
jgi:hypothetical protein